uniref:Transmembrane protein 134 (inferred by orthology to a human protein) n=1 Tax=Strongyloides venezuelensis TaxID=75913 RepID=A0A0K0FXN0_STRVS
MMGHSRNLSQGQHLIGTEHHDGDEEILTGRMNNANVHTESSRVYRPDNTPSSDHLNNYTTLSDCGSYYQPTNGVSPKKAQIFCCCCTDPYLKTNIKVVILSILLTIVGLIIAIFGFIAIFCLSHIDLQAWLFVIVGILFFIPGCYHCVYILCVLSGRPGYKFENLPTFKRPLPIV